ncbi:MAG: hypothetical protein O7C75_18635 [Verrucomicrobia bacterium]|nr:hypothetical protein [Verrucomicrobiota bacterium]
MSDRLSKLQQQKRLIEEHLRWLEQEIEAESGQSVDSAKPEAQESTPPIPVTTAIPLGSKDTPIASAPVQEEESVEGISDELISRYAHASARREMDPKLGCILYAVGALAFIALVIFAIYWFGYR